MDNSQKIAWLALGGLLLAVCLAAVFEFGGPHRRQGDTITILRGENAFQIADDLKAEGYIKSKLLFLFEAARSGNFKNLKFGEYDLKTLAARQIIDVLVSGKTAARAVTVIPGQTARDIGQSLAKAKIAAADGFADAAENAANYKDEFDFLQNLPADSGLEGYLFPDTYHVDPKADPASVIRAMLENFDGKLMPDMRNKVGAQKKSVNDVVIMASILEKEVKTLEDKKIVAGILWKRLKNKMPLQVDSSLLYYKISDGKTIDKDIDSPYNTYKYAGLPPGPICNPGGDSLEAAIEPIDTSYWYYLSAPDGATVFSKTYDEHLANIARYLNK